MDDNLGETPNPLNPNPTEPLEATPESGAPVADEPIAPRPVQRPIQRPVQRPVRPSSQRRVMNDMVNPVVREPRRPIHPSPMDRPMEKAPEPEIKPVETAPEPIDGPAKIAPAPLDRPMEKAPEPETKPKKKKTGLIIGIIICLFVAIGCAVAAVLLMLNNNTGDVITKAFKKLASDEAPKNISIDGNISLKINDQDSPFSSVDVLLDSDIVLDTMINSTDATIAATMRESGEQIALEIDEIYATSDNLFIRLNGVKEAIEKLSTMMNDEPTVVDCGADGEDCLPIKPLMTDDTLTTDSLVVTDCEIAEDCLSIETQEVYGSSYDLLEFLEAFAENPEAIDGQWFRIPVSSLTTSGYDDGSLTCLTRFASDISSSRDNLVNLYQENPFVMSSTENITYSSKKNPIYKLTLDDKKLTAFIDATNGLTPVKNLSNCLGSGNNIDTESISELAKEIPEAYVEIDNRDRFTRLLFITDVEGVDATLTVDLGFSYPSNINISEPFEYQDLPIGTEIYE